MAIGGTLIPFGQCLGMYHSGGDLEITMRHQSHRQVIFTWWISLAMLAEKRICFMFIPTSKDDSRDIWLRLEDLKPPMDPDV